MAELASFFLAITGGVDITVRTSSKIAQLIHEWKDAPAQIISLDEEIQNSRQVAMQLKAFCESLGANPDAFDVTAVSSLVRKAKPSWVKLEEILESLRDSKGRLRKGRWIKIMHQVTSLQGKLRELRLATVEILSIYTASQSIRIESAVASYHNIQKAWITSTSEILSDISSRIEAGRCPTVRNILEEHSSEDGVAVDDSTSGTIESAFATIRYLDGPGETCNSRCPCRCHIGKRHSRFRVDLLSGILGSLSIIYSGWEFAGPRCNVLYCCRARFKLFEVTYSTPLRPNSVSIIASIKLTDVGPTIGLSIGKTANIADEEDHLSIVSVTKAGTLSELKYRLERRPDAVLDVYYLNGFSALHNAGLLGKFDMAKILLAAGANPFLEDKWGVPALFECFQRILRGDDSPQKKNALKECLPLSEFFDEYNFSDIEKVVLGIRPLPLQAELNKGIFGEELNVQDDMGMTPLHWAAINRDISAVTMLLDAGANSNIPDKRGLTALYEACRSNSESCAQKLIAFGADINARYKLGYTPLHAAAIGNATRGLLSLLLSAGADINDSNNAWGASPLNRAAGNNNASCCEHLLDLGADIDSENRNGDTPLYAAIEANAHACIKLLLLRGANYLHKCSREETLLHKASMRGDGRTFEILAAADLRGLEIDAKHIKLMTARQYFATRSGLSLETMELFEVLLKSLNKGDAQIEDTLELDSSDEGIFFDALEG